MIILNGVKYIGEKEASSKYGLSVSWFRGGRYEKCGPPFHKLRGKVYYNEGLLEKWLTDNLKLMGS